MSFSGLGRWEWIILELGFLGLLFFELFKIRRTIWRDRQAEAASKQAERARDAEGQHGADH